MLIETGGDLNEKQLAFIKAAICTARGCENDQDIKVEGVDIAVPIVLDAEHFDLYCDNIKLKEKLTIQEKLNELQEAMDNYNVDEVTRNSIQNHIKEKEKVLENKIASHEIQIKQSRGR